ncbi:MAG TPA: class II aldolase/adducin family protein [Actinomycetota bacterium]|nr:class II aldolase/adducin family protein [Actinomycetota bacterium]
MKHVDVREAVARTALEMEQRNLTIGTSGNVSARVPEGAIITPSSVPYAEIRAEDTILIDLDGKVLADDGVHERIPSVEHKVHLECYKIRADVNAVVHSHPTMGSVFAAARMPLPAFLDEFGVYVGDEVRVAEYALSGSEEIAQNVVKAMGETANAVFLASHGMVCVGKDLRAAMHVTMQVERAALIYLYARMLGGPAELPEESRDLFAQVFQYFRTS